MDYQNMGVFEKLRGLLVGRPMSYSEARSRRFCGGYWNEHKGIFFRLSSDMDFGHTAPQFTIPLGCRAG